MSVDKGSKKRLDLKTLAAAVGLDRARGDDMCAHGETIFARLPPDAYDDPAIDLHDKLSELLDAARSITPATGGAKHMARRGDLPKFLNSALDDYIIGTIAAGPDAALLKADATDKHREPGDVPAPFVSASRPLRQRFVEAVTGVSTIAVFCAFGASVGTLSALGFAPRQNDAAYATMAKGLSTRSVAREEVILRRFEFVMPDRCADVPCPTLTLKILPPAGVAPPVRATKADGNAASVRQAETLTSVREPEEAPVVSPAARAVAVAEPSVIAVEDAQPDVEVVELEPVLPAPDGFDALSAIVLRGLPAGSTLSAGRKISDTEWALPAGDLDNVVVTFPENVPPRFRATVELIRRGGQPAASLNIVVRHTPGSRSVPLAAIAKDVLEQRDAGPDRANPDDSVATVHEDNAKDPSHPASGSRVADEPGEKAKPARKVARTRSETAKPAPKAKKPRTAAAKSAPQPTPKPSAPAAAMTIRQPRDLDAGAQIQHSLGAPVWGPPAPAESATPTTLFGLLFGEPQGE